MSNTWLFIDANNLAHRAFHAMGGLSHEGNATGMLYGFFRDIVVLEELHETNKVAFCFDDSPCFRTSIYPNYKASRRVGNDKLSAEERKRKKEFYGQIQMLRSTYLPRIGFRNIFMGGQWEADDQLALLCQRSLPKADEAIVVSSDKDLYQLLTNRVRIWNPFSKKTITKAWFTKEYGIPPSQWALVKAIAGCATDDVKGIVGVGDKTASRYLAGVLSESSQSYRTIMDAENKMIACNLPLTELAWDASPRDKPKLVEDEISIKAWYRLADELGMKSLKERNITPRR